MAESQQNLSASLRSWTFEKKTRGPWFGSMEPQRDRYWAARERPTCRNLGPSGRSFGARDWVKTYWVVQRTVAVPAGVVLPSGLVVPSGGATLNCVPLAPRTFSAGQAKKLLRKVQRRFPEATVIESIGEPDDQRSRMPSISAPSAPPGWWDVRKPELAPRVSWRQFVAAAAP